MTEGPTVSPLAPKDGFPAIPAVGGVRFAAIEAGVRYADRTDVMIAELAPGSAIAGVYTQSRTRSAAVEDCVAKTGLDSPDGAAIIVNSGNANAFTGAAGRTSVTTIAEAVAARLGVPESRVFTGSTGVIGEPLPHDRILATLDTLADGLSPGGIAGAAHAIMTTDTFPKGAVRQIEIVGQPVTIAGIAKGSGMIAPDMATMLGYVFTDAAVDRAYLQDLLLELTRSSFNAITVDSDTSTSDTVLLAATGQAGTARIEGPDSPGADAFQTALSEVMTDLAHQIVRDGEGATKFVELRVTGARDDTDARTVAFAIANSPLVKTAVAGEDPNWGRVVMAVGKSGAEADRDRLSIWFGDVLVAKNGTVAADYVEAEAAAHMRRDEVVITADLGIGPGTATVWTCDLTRGYIDINADYRS